MKRGGHQRKRNIKLEIIELRKINQESIKLID